MYKFDFYRTPLAKFKIFFAVTAPKLLSNFTCVLLLMFAIFRLYFIWVQYKVNAFAT